jgi:phosphate acetyltransferase
LIASVGQRNGFQTQVHSEDLHPRLRALVERARSSAIGSVPFRLGVVYPCDALSMDAVNRVLDISLATPVLIGPKRLMERAATDAKVDLRRFELVETPENENGAARIATEQVKEGRVAALMKGSLHTDALMGAVVNKATGLRGKSRISHVFLFDLPGFHKMLAVADCVVNIAPDLKTKADILGNAIEVLQRIGVPKPKVAIVAAVEVVTPAIPATQDAAALVAMSHAGAWPGAWVEGPFGFDNAISAEAALAKKMTSKVAGDPDLLLMPDLNSGNILYKSFNFMAGGACAGLVLGAQVPIVLMSRADSLVSRIASVALAALVVNGASEVANLS